jgi:hypothetical protein
VTGNVANGPSGGFLDAGIKLFQALNQSRSSTTIDDGLRQLRRMLSNRAKDKSSRFLVEALITVNCRSGTGAYVLLVQRVHQLGQNFAIHCGRGQVRIVIGQATEPSLM